MGNTSPPGRPEHNEGEREKPGCAWEMPRGSLADPATCVRGGFVVAVVFLSLSLPFKIKWEKKKSRRK